MIKMLRFQLIRLCGNIESGFEEEQSRLKKVNDIRRCIELLDNMINDNYDIRCGYIEDSRNISEIFVRNTDGCYLSDNPNHTPEERLEIFKAAVVLEKKEMKEFTTLLRNMKSWWN